MRRVILSIFLLVTAAGCAGYRAGLTVNHRYRVFFPPIKLATADGERIESVEIRMSCGRFRAVTAIPDDWSVEVVSPSSEKTTLRASAGHGSSTLWSMGTLDGAVTVSVEETSCFDVTATVGTTATVHQFTRSELILKP
jgi:hypothetical protein